MRNKRIKTVSLIFLFLILASPTYASLGESLESKEDRFKARQEQMEGKKEERQENRQENRQERRTDIASKHADRLEQHFKNYFTRFTAIIGKIDARIAATTNKNTDQAKAKLTDAKAKLAYAVVTGEKAVSQFRSIDPAKWPDQKEQAKVAQATANEAREAFKATLALMVESIKVLKSAPNK